MHCQIRLEQSGTHFLFWNANASCIYCKSVEYPWDNLISAAALSVASCFEKPFCWVPHWGRWRWGSFWIFAFWHILDWNLLQADGTSKDLLCILLEQCKQQAVGCSFGISLLGSSSAVGQFGHCNTAWETNSDKAPNWWQEAGLRLFFLTFFLFQK